MLYYRLPTVSEWGEVPFLLLCIMYHVLSSKNQYKCAISNVCRCMNQKEWTNVKKKKPTTTTTTTKNVRWKTGTLRVCLWHWIHWFIPSSFVVYRHKTKCIFCFEPVGWFVGRSGSGLFFIFYCKFYLFRATREGASKALTTQYTTSYELYQNHFRHNVYHWNGVCSDYQIEFTTFIANSLSSDSTWTRICSFDCYYHIWM